MYGLKEAAILAYDQLSKFFNAAGYHHVPGTAGLWTHSTRPTAFCLCVDDIALKYYNASDLQHFLTTLSTHYKYHIDHSGSHYMGFDLNWQYDKGFVDLSMPKYIPTLLDHLNHPLPKKPQYSPHEHQPFHFLKKGQRQLATQPDSSPLITDTKEIK